MSQKSSEKKRGLGMGLSALLGDEAGSTTEGKGDGYSTMPVDRLHPSSVQPRKIFDAGELDALTDTIREHGVMQPLVVRESPEKARFFEIVAGERRWRASQRAGLHEVPVIIRDLSDLQALELALIENLQRHDLNPIEEAAAFQRLGDQFAYTQDQISQRVGKSRSHVANIMRLLTLPEAVHAHLATGRLSAGHARALIGTEDPAALAQQVIDQQLNVRQTEELVRQMQGTKDRKAEKKPVPKSADLAALERDLCDRLGLKLNIAPKADGKRGKLTIDYKSLDELDRVLDILRRA